MINAKSSENNIALWVEEYADKMYSWAYYKTSSKETAEDLVQDTFLSAYTNLSGFKGESNPKTWLFSILNNKISDFYRKKLRTPTILEQLQSDQSADHIFSVTFDNNDNWEKEQKPQGWGKDEENMLDNNEFNDVLQECLKKLPAQWLSAVELKYIQGKKGEEICQELGIAATNYWQILHRAKLQLRKCLELKWFKL
jgi:RNA polymerase sigma-70 factor (TIGR02943 family)